MKMPNVNNLAALLSMDFRIWGVIPGFLDPGDPRDAAEQFNDHYIGGWQPFKGFQRDPSGRPFTIVYPGEEPMAPIAKFRWNDDTVCMYEHEWVAIYKPDETFEVCRMD